MRLKREARFTAVALVMAWGPAFAAVPEVELAGIAMPRYLQLSGVVLELTSCGVRNTLWLEHYAAALYVPRGASMRAVQDRSEPKAVLMHVLDERFLPRRIPQKWRGPLGGSLDRATYSRVHRAFAELKTGDRVRILYRPGTGLSMRVNGRLIARAQSHGVIDAILEAWREGDTVAGRLERLASEHPCR